MDLLQMQYFTEIAEQGNMTKAAEKLGVAQSTLSLSCKRLEAELGVALFLRSGRTLQITEAGRYFCHEAQDILKRTDRLYQEMRRIRETDVNTVVVCSEVVDITNKTEQRFRKIKPAVHIREIRCIQGQDSVLLLAGKADLALTLQDRSDEQLCSMLLFKEPMLLMAASDTAIGRQKTFSVRDLQGLPLVTQQDDYAIAALFHSYYDMAGIRPSEIIQVGDPETLPLLVMQHKGVSFVPRSVPEEWKDGRYSFLDNVSLLTPEEVFCQREVWLTVRRDKHLSSAASEYTDFLRECTDAISLGGNFPD